MNAYRAGNFRFALESEAEKGVACETTSSIYTTCTGGYEYQHRRGRPAQFRYLSMGKPSRMRRPDGLHTKGL